MAMRYKHLTEWADAQPGRRHARRSGVGREAWPPRALTVFAAAARFVERATRRNGL
jgi:hypothetical protein